MVCCARRTGREPCLSACPQGVAYTSVLDGGGRPVDAAIARGGSPQEWAASARQYCCVAARTYAFNDAYLALVRELKSEGRMHLTNDLDTVGRLLRARRADFTILPFVTAHGSLEPGLAADDPDGVFAYQPVAGMAKMQLGLYLSRHSLPLADLALLCAMVIEMNRDGSFRRMMARYFPESLLAEDGL